MRLRDLPGYLRSLGYSAHLIPSKTMLGTQMRHRGVHVGGFFLGEKEGGREFTSEDEDVLVLFASQAATAIANAGPLRGGAAGCDRVRSRGTYRAPTVKQRRWPGFACSQHF